MKQICILKCIPAHDGIIHFSKATPGLAAQIGDCQNNPYWTNEHLYAYIDGRLIASTDPRKEVNRIPDGFLSYYCVYRPKKAIVLDYEHSMKGDEVQMMIMKEFYTREEVEKLLMKLYNDSNQSIFYSPKFLSDWMEKNL